VQGLQLADVENDTLVSPSSPKQGSLGDVCAPRQPPPSATVLRNSDMMFSAKVNQQGDSDENRYGFLIWFLSAETA
jgi:hypothetical protein